jgi:hypothetical protein
MTYSDINFWNGLILEKIVMLLIILSIHIDLIGERCYRSI